MSSRANRVTLSEIWEITDNGRTIFEQVLGKISKYNVKSPLRDDGSIASFKVFVGDDGIYRYKDFGGKGESGNGIDLVMKLNGLSFIDALKYIKNNSIPINYLPQNAQSKIVNKEDTLIEFTDYPFEEKHKKYWDKYHLPEEFLRNNNVFAVKKWAINKKIQKFDDSTAVFAYYHKELDKVKILQIGEKVEKKNKWRNNVPNEALWYLPEEKCDELWVSKSVKDSLVMKYHFGKCSCAVQNEDHHHLEKNMSTLLDISPNVVLNFGSDKMAVENCKIVQQKYNTKYFNTPKYLLQYGIQDISDLIDQFGVDVAKKELIKKKFL